MVNQFRTDIQICQCDNGHEFNNQPLLDFFKNHGIIVFHAHIPHNKMAKLNAPFEPSIIWFIHRCFKHPFPPCFLVEALLSSTHTFNHLLISTLNFKTHFKILFGFSPTYSHLGVFVTPIHVQKLLINSLITLMRVFTLVCVLNIVDIIVLISLLKNLSYAIM